MVFLIVFFASMAIAGLGAVVVLWGLLVPTSRIGRALTGHIETSTRSQALREVTAVLLGPLTFFLSEFLLPGTLLPDPFWGAHACFAQHGNDCLFYVGDMDLINTESLLFLALALLVTLIFLTITRRVETRDTTRADEDTLVDFATLRRELAGATSDWTLPVIVRAYDLAEDGEEDQQDEAMVLVEERGYCQSIARDETTLIATYRKHATEGAGPPTTIARTASGGYSPTMQSWALQFARARPMKIRAFPILLAGAAFEILTWGILPKSTQLFVLVFMAYYIVPPALWMLAFYELLRTFDGQAPRTWYWPARDAFIALLVTFPAFLLLGISNGIGYLCAAPATAACLAQIRDEHFRETVLPWLVYLGIAGALFLLMLVSRRAHGHSAP